MTRSGPPVVMLAGGAIDYAMLTKLYGASGNDNSAETRYSPG